MPNFDGRGPNSRSLGRGLGPCGRGQRRGFSKRSRDFNFTNNISFQNKEEQNQFLKETIQDLEQEKKELEKQLEQLNQK